MILFHHREHRGAQRKYFIITEFTIYDFETRINADFRRLNNKINNPRESELICVSGFVTPFFILIHPQRKQNRKS